MVTALDASSNGVEELPLSVPEVRVVLRGLTELRLAHNNLTGDLRAFASPARLVHLDVSHNPITSTAGVSGHLLQLRTLNLAGTQISSVDGLVGLPALVELDVSHCRITSTQRLRGLSLNPCLRVLQLTGNPLTAAAAGGHYRVAVLHILPSLSVLDGRTCYPHRSSQPDPTSALSQAAVVGSSYTSIHRAPPPPQQRKPTTAGPRYAQDTQAELVRRGKRSGSFSHSSNSSSSTYPPGAAAPDVEESPPPPIGYAPPWRRPPNPLPQGYRDYGGLAAECLKK